jgi:Protein of unknown function (DUF3313)
VGNINTHISYYDGEGDMKNKQVFSISAVLMMAVALLMTGCFSGKQAGSVKFSGFLDPNYDLLKKGGPGQAQYQYVKPDVNYAAYNKILLEPVVILRPADAKGAVPEDVQTVANNFYSQIVTELSKQDEMVKEAGPNTIRVQVALTEVSPGSPTGQVITSIVPYGIALSAVQHFVGAKPAFSGELSVEVKATDSQSGELLAAGVDRRIADKSLKAAMHTWEELTKVTEIWSKMFAFRLCTIQGRMDCVSPFPEK